MGTSLLGTSSITGIRWRSSKGRTDCSENTPSRASSIHPRPETVESELEKSREIAEEWASRPENFKSLGTLGGGCGAPICSPWLYKWENYSWEEVNRPTRCGERVSDAGIVTGILQSPAGSLIFPKCSLAEWEEPFLQAQECLVVCEWFSSRKDGEKQEWSEGLNGLNLNPGEMGVCGQRTMLEINKHGEGGWGHREGMRRGTLVP